MAILNLDQASVGQRPPVPYSKSGAVPQAGFQRGYTHWYVGGTPGASAAPTIGVNGEAVVPTLNTPANVLGSRLDRGNPGSGLEARVYRLGMNASQGCSMWLVDRLWQNAGLSATLTTLQSITPAALPARDRNNANLGDGVMCAIEWSATGGAGTPTETLTYTNSDGVTGRTATVAGVANAPIGTWEIFNLAQGDRGIREITGFQHSATRTSGAFHLILFRMISQVEIIANIGGAIDFLAGGGQQIYDNSVLQAVFFPSSNAAFNVAGQYIETHG